MSVAQAGLATGIEALGVAAAVVRTGFSVVCLPVLHLYQLEQLVNNMILSGIETDPGPRTLVHGGQLTTLVSTTRIMISYST